MSVRRQITVGLALVEQLADARIGEVLMREPGDLRELPAAMLDPAGRLTTEEPWERWW